MNADEIDELVIDINNPNGDLETQKRFYEKYVGTTITSLEDREEVSNGFKIIMGKIENGDYNYFKQLIKEGHPELIFFMIFSTKINDIKEFIDNREQLGVDSYMLKALIIATGEPDYIKGCIKEREELGLGLEIVKDLIIATGEPDYIKGCIKEREELGLGLEIVKDLIIATGEPDYIKGCIKEREQLGLNYYHLMNLIETIGEPDYIISCIKDREQLGLYLDWLINLLKEIGGPDYIKSCIKDREQLGLWSYDIVKLIIATKEPDYIKSCIKDREQLDLEHYDIANLIIETRDPDYIKSCIKDREQLGLEHNDIANLIIETREPDYIKSCIKVREQLGLEHYDIANLIIATRDPDYIKKCIQEREQTNELVELLLLIGDLNLIEQYQNKAEEFGIKPEDCKKLSMITKKTQITLPPNMTIGVEIESEGIDTKIIERLLEEKNWTTKGDGSLRDGTEVVSDILTGDTKSSSNEIKSVCAVLNGVGQNISDRCGGHIHIGADYLTSRQDWNNLIQIWGNAEKVLYIISNEEGNIPRDGAAKYAGPISKKIETAIEHGTINLEGEEDLENFAKKISEIQGERYSGINFKNVCPGQKKNTIEFRLPNGTLNPNTWIENINLFGGIIRSAHELTQIQKKPEDQRTETERKTLECFEILQTEQDEEKVLQALLELCVAPEQKQLYMDRYEVNRPLIEGLPTINNALTEQISTNKIGKKSLAGKDPITGEDYQQGASYIEAELARNEVSQGLGQGGE